MAAHLDGGGPHGLPRNPSAQRNKVPIRRVLEHVLPASGDVLEIASGTGEHVLHFAEAMPGLRWHPSEIDAALRRSMSRAIEAAGLTNVEAPLALDVRGAWPIDRADALVCINMIHIAPWAASRGLFSGAERVLADGAAMVVYGPFRRFGEHTAPSNARFDASLRAQDREWGIRAVEDVAALAGGHGLDLAEVVEMPANNLCLIFRRQDGTRDGR